VPGAPAPDRRMVSDSCSTRSDRTHDPS
jgi:hypothetical protein